MYLSLEAQFHDHFWDSEQQQSELPLLETFLADNPGKTLEIGCGSGRLLLPLLSKGYDIEGLETSLDMIELLEAKAKSAKLSPTIHHANACEPLPVETQYTSYLIPAFTIQLFSRPQTLTLLEHLKTRSTGNLNLYLTIFIPWAEITGELQEEEWNNDKNIELPDRSIARCETNHTIDRLNQTLFRNHRYTHTSSDKSSNQTHHSQQTIHYYGLPELKTLLKQTGWHVDKVITDMDPNYFNTDAHILTIHASTSN